MCPPCNLISLTHSGRWNNKWTNQSVSAFENPIMFSGQLHVHVLEWCDKYDRHSSEASYLSGEKVSEGGIKASVRL